jgi:transposase
MYVGNSRARSAVRVLERGRDPRSLAISRLKARRGPNVAAVALANHNARVLWALLTRGEEYRARAAQGPAVAQSD